MEDKALLEAIGKMIDEKMDSKLDPITEDIRQIKMTLEHDVSSKIQSIYEGHLLNSEKLDQIQAGIDDMAPTVTALDVLHQMQKKVSQ